MTYDFPVKDLVMPDNSTNHTSRFDAANVASDTASDTYEDGGQMLKASIKTANDFYKYAISSPDNPAYKLCTTAGRSTYITAYVLRAFGDCQLNEITADDIIAYCEKVNEMPLKINSKNAVCSGIRCFFSRVKEAGLIQQNPVLLAQKKVLTQGMKDHLLFRRPRYGRIISNQQ